MIINEKTKIAVIGLGYVGLPLAVEFGKKFTTFGYDISPKRIEDLKTGKDITKEVSSSEIGEALNLKFVSQVEELALANVYIVTVPTPINENKQPNLDPLISATHTISRYLNKGDTVIYESTVYPGATEEICLPILKKNSGLKFNVDFFVGYSPERINPGDKNKRLVDIQKVTSGSTAESATFIDELYKSIVQAGTYKASSIKVAEAAKVIENTQRDVNIALINELSMIFNEMNIDTEEVLVAAETKWNFLSFRPGLVGGHCIGVDPYYLTHKSQELGYHPEIILAGRKINDGMAVYSASKLIKEMLRNSTPVQGAKILVLGLTFKENCPDVRNTKIIDLIRELEDYGAKVSCYDPWVDPNIAMQEFDLPLLEQLESRDYDATIVAVSHQEFLDLGAAKIKALGSSRNIVFDLKYSFAKDESDLRL